MGFLTTFTKKEKEEPKSNLTVKEMVIKTSLAKMFKDDHFSICTIDSCVEVAQVRPEKEIYDMPRALHYVPYGDMDRSMREWLVEAVISIFVPENAINLDFLNQIRLISEPLNK